MAGASDRGTSRFKTRSLEGSVAPESFREAFGLQLSSVGLGTYLGKHDEATDALYREAIRTALRLGCNVLDTASNYRCQRSERVIGQVLGELGPGDGNGPLAREEIFVSTKGGFVPFDGEPPEDANAFLRERFLEPGILSAEELVGGCHSLAAGFLRHQIDQSRENLGVETVDLYYLHNPEMQLSEVNSQEFGERLRSAFRCLEEEVAAGKIGCYGTATWNAYRTDPEAKDYLSLPAMAAIAEEVGGEKHHFRFVQLPFNLAMTEALANPNQEVGGEKMSVLQAAEALGIKVMSSASIAQGRLTRGLPDWFGTLFKGFASDTQRSIQFARSTPGITAALVGMKRLEHVRENLATIASPPAPLEDFMKLFEVDEK